MEIKFFDRLKALEKLEEITDQGQNGYSPVFMRRWKTAPSCCKKLGLGRMRA